MTMTLKRAREIAGKTSTRNTKMPGSTFALSAKHCHKGRKLAKVPGSVCSACYALRIQKLRPSVDKGWTANQKRATSAIERDAFEWVAAMVLQIERDALRTGEPFHRWFDSGDLDSVEMLAAIVEVAEQTPHIQHWLPTRETGIVRDYRTAYGGDFPANLVVRVSSPMVGDKPLRQYGHTSTVHKAGTEHVGHQCPAPDQGNACGDCRACWDPAVANVSYRKH